MSTLEDHVREGSASYAGKGRGLRDDLAHFEHVDSFPAKSVHGGWFPARTDKPVVGRAFVVGDAAGQCLPFTGEGIRPALVFGQAAGREARAVLEGRQSLGAALARYRTVAERSRFAFRAIEHFQSWSVRLSLPLVAPMIQACSWAPLSRRLQATYWSVADPGTLEVAPGEISDTVLSQPARGTVTQRTGSGSPSSRPEDEGAS